MFGELLAPHYLHWLLDGFVLTLLLSLLTCLIATTPQGASNPSHHAAAQVAATGFRR